MSGWRLAALPLALVAFVAMSAPVLAQAKYPSRPIRVMLPFAAGSVSDVTLRILADKLGARLNTSVVVDNQPRAGGTTAAAAVLTAPRDGYSLVTLSSSTAISVSLLKSLPYDPVADFVPICGISTFANIIAVNRESKYRTLNDLLAAMREQPGKLNFGTTTVGSTNHLAANLLKSMTGQTFQIVPFRTPGDLVTAVLRNDVDVIIQSYGALKSAVEGGQLRALASTTPGAPPTRPTCRPSTRRASKASTSSPGTASLRRRARRRRCSTRSTARSARCWPTPISGSAMPIWDSSRCRTPRPSLAPCCGPKSANGAASSPMPGSKSSRNRGSLSRSLHYSGLPPRPEIDYHAAIPATVLGEGADMELEGNLVLERRPARRWVSVVAVIVPVVACLAGVTWFIRAFISPPTIAIPNPMTLAAAPPAPAVRAEPPAAAAAPPPGGGTGRAFAGTRRTLRGARFRDAVCVSACTVCVSAGAVPRAGNHQRRGLCRSGP